MAALDTAQPIGHGSVKAVLLLKSHLGKATVKVGGCRLQRVGFLLDFLQAVRKVRHAQQHHKHLLILLVNGVADGGGVFFLLLVARGDGRHKVEVFHIAAVGAELLGVNFHLGGVDFPQGVLGFDRRNVDAQHNVRHLLEQRCHKLIIELLRILCNRHCLGKSVVDFRVLGRKAHGIGCNRVPEIIAQFAVILIKAEQKATFLAAPKEVVQYFQPFVVCHWFDRTAQIGKLRQKVALHLPQTAAGVSDILLVGGQYQILVLHHIARILDALADSAVALYAPFIQTVKVAMQQNIFAEGFLVHTLADNADFQPIVCGHTHIHLAEQVKDSGFVLLAAHCKIDVGHGPHLAVHIAAAPCPVLVDSVDGDALLHTARHLAAAVGPLGGSILT